jgi:hypothetical protein
VDQPFAILSVNSDTLDVAKKAKIEDLDAVRPN